MMIFDTNPKKLGVSLSKLHLASLDEHKNDLIYENLMVLLGFSPWPNGGDGVEELVCFWLVDVMR